MSENREAIEKVLAASPEIPELLKLDPFYGPAYKALKAFEERQKT